MFQRLPLLVLLLSILNASVFAQEEDDFFSMDDITEEEAALDWALIKLQRAIANISPDQRINPDVDNEFAAEASNINILFQLGELGQCGRALRENFSVESLEQFKQILEGAGYSLTDTEEEVVSKIFKTNSSRSGFEDLIAALAQAEPDAEEAEAQVDAGPLSREEAAQFSDWANHSRFLEVLRRAPTRASAVFNNPDLLGDFLEKTKSFTEDEWAEAFKTAPGTMSFLLEAKGFQQKLKKKKVVGILKKLSNEQLSELVSALESSEAEGAKTARSWLKEAMSCTSRVAAQAGN